MEREEIIEEIVEQNPWWEGKPVKLPEKSTERTIEKKIFKELDKKRITTIIGLRRVGKTTLTKILIQKLLKNVNPKRIMYFSFDLSEEVNPRELIKLYSEEILKKPLSETEEKLYFFFDEIQKIENWENQIKSLHDKEYPIKFTVTGSSSMNITKGAGESLSGRTRIHRLEPFSFKEFLLHKGIKIPEVNLKNPSYPIKAEKLRIAFKEYMEKGGLPELYQKEIEDPKKFLDEITDLTLFRDIVDMFSVRRTKVLKGIFRIITEHTGQKVNYQKISKDLDTEYRTVKEYIQHLEDSFLIKESYPLEISTYKRLRKNPKIYTADHAYNKLWGCKEGLKAETIAFNHLKKIEEPNYNSDPETDIILPEKKMAFEIKYKSNLSEKDAKQLTKLPEQFNLFLITKNKYEKWQINKRDVQLIPLWLLCLSYN